MPFSSLRFRLVGTVLFAILPALLLLWIIESFMPRSVDPAATTQSPLQRLPWGEFIIGLVALGAAWFGGERYILRQVRQLASAAQQLTYGDLSARTGMAKENSELGELARVFDEMAGSLERRVKDKEKVEKALLDKNFQQTVVSALGQFALVSGDFPALLNQAVMLVAQTLRAEYCGVLEIIPHRQEMLLRAGVGWKPGNVGSASEPLSPDRQFGYTLKAGEPVLVENLPSEPRFKPAGLLADHAVLSGVTVVISGNSRSYGVLGVHTSTNRKFSEDEVHFLLAVATVLAMGVERARTGEQLEKQSLFTQLNPTPLLELSAQAEVTYLNDAAERLIREIADSKPANILPPNILETVHQCLEQDTTARFETQAAERTLSWSLHPVKDWHVVHSYVEDVTRRLNLEMQLRHSQKMESIGQLAAGVAHDFNNMLTIIQGHAAILNSRPHLPKDLHESAQAIHFASERAAALTRQLLMFSRKNVIQSKPLDLVDLVANLGKMLQRLIGEPVKLIVQSPPSLPLIKADVGMIEQVVMNLAVNARDAMPRGGTLTISLDHITLDAAYLQSSPQARPGNFVRLRARDTGSGMDPATLSRIFEPFFTTKEIGKGTGLGLATVYGILRQHDGWIEVASELGRGSSFTLFFPAIPDQPGARHQTHSPPEPLRGGTELILIVEDEPLLRDMAVMILSERGYRTMAAASGMEALAIWEKHASEIDLLLTDMVMPEGVSGMDLAIRLLGSKPGLPIIFASGYSMDDLDTSFVRKGHAIFLQKPYTPAGLTQAVRRCLDGQGHTNPVAP